MHKADAQNSDFINIIPSTYKSDSFEINIKANNWKKKIRIMPEKVTGIYFQCRSGLHV